MCNLQVDVWFHVAFLGVVHVHQQHHCSSHHDANIGASVKRTR